MSYIEEWPSRFMAYHRSATAPEDVQSSPLGNPIATVTEGHRRTQDMLEIARSQYGTRLMWIEIEVLDRNGSWNPMGRFRPK